MTRNNTRSELFPIIGDTLARQLIEQRLRLPQVSGVEPFGEPAIDLGQQLAGCVAFALTVLRFRLAFTWGV